MRVLRVLLALVDVGGRRQEARAVALADVAADFGHRVVADARRIGAHVGDQADRAFLADLDTFIQALRQHHGALHAEASLRDESCCSVEVMNGATGLRFFSRVATLLTR